MTREELEERIKMGERFFIIYSNDLRQLKINLSDHNDDYTKCIPHLDINEYTKPFSTPRPFPILVEYTDNNQFEIVSTRDKINILDSEEGETFLSTIKVGNSLKMSIAFTYVKSALAVLSENPLAIPLTSIKSLEGFSTWEMEEILNNKDLTKKQRELIEDKIKYLINLYKNTHDNYRLLIKEGHERVCEQHRAEIRRQLYEQWVRGKFSDFVEELYASRQKGKTLTITKRN